MGELETRVAECVKEYAENGFWRTCSGCHETADGHDIGHYPFNKAFDCKLGSGCSECGGIGAVWDTTDYLDMAHQIGRSPGSIATPEPNWASAAEREAVKAGQSAAFEYSETGGGPIGIFLAGLRAYRIALSPPASPVAFKKPDHPEAVDPLFVKASAFQPWMETVFTIPLYLTPVLPTSSEPVVTALTVGEALAQLTNAFNREKSVRDRQAEMLATIIVNVEKSEPTAEFATALREYVRDNRPALARTEAQ